MESVDSSAKKAQELIDKETAQNPDIVKILKIVREFIESHRVMCYGGTAINNLLPEKDQFYDLKKEVPDYDFFSETPQLHGTKIADRILKAGYENVEVKPGIHLGTYKVFVNYMGVADISHLDREIFQKLWKDSIVKNNIHYVPPDFLRMSMYLELSRPKGDVSRWTKVFKRLQLLNNAYPIVCKESPKTTQEYLTEDTRQKIQDILIKEKVVLLGFNASMMQTKNSKWTLPMDIISTPENKEDVVNRLKSFFAHTGKIKTKSYAEYGELFPSHTDILDDQHSKLLVRVYESNACHSYHESKDGLFIASIPTILQFVFSTLYAHKHFLEDSPEQRYICNAQHLIDIKGTKKLTPITCLGKQKNLGDLREDRSKLYEKYSKDKSSPEFVQYFFMYSPAKLNKTQRRKTRDMLKKTLRNI
jgi:hypothetical protein